MSSSHPLPPGVVVLERGWLSANNILFTGPGTAAVVDSGYTSHAAQTVQLVEGALRGRPLGLLLNTHLHSDHCGGNAALQERYPGLQTLVPPGLAEHVRSWDPVALTYVATGQHCPRFFMNGVLAPGSTVELGGLGWEVHGAPGHDPHSVVLFEPGSRTLISADALWENGFGAVFQELEGEQAFDEVAATLDLIEGLAPRLVLPGHGKAFGEVDLALASARRRLDSFVRDPLKHARHAAKVLLKFRLLDLQQSPLPDLVRWAAATPYITLVHQRWFVGLAMAKWIEQLADDLARSGAARREGDLIINT
jgi:glyoxylase-like metal-dependent hydrolase (beta-lactamase superfamily II)